MDSYKEKVQDKYLDCTQTGWGVTPIIGLNFNYKKWNVGTRMEFNTYLNIQNNTKRDDTGMFKHGVNTPNDIPALWTIGVQYAVLPNLRTMVSYHHFFDTHGKQQTRTAQWQHTRIFGRCRMGYNKRCYD